MGFFRFWCTIMRRRNFLKFFFRKKIILFNFYFSFYQYKLWYHFVKNSYTWQPRILLIRLTSLTVRRNFCLSFCLEIENYWCIDWIFCCIERMSKWLGLFFAQYWKISVRKIIRHPFLETLFEKVKSLDNTEQGTISSGLQAAFIWMQTLTFDN